MGYVVLEVDGCTVVRGRVPASKLAQLLKAAGDGVADQKLAEMMGATMVFGPKDKIDALRVAIADLVGVPDVVRVRYTSEWAEGNVTTLAKLEISTGRVFDIEVSEDGAENEHLIREYISPVSGGDAEVEVEDQKRIDLKDQNFDADQFRPQLGFVDAINSMMAQFPELSESDEEVDGADLIDFTNEFLLVYVHPKIEEMIREFPGFIHEYDVDAADFGGWVVEHLVPVHRERACMVGG